MSRKLIENKTSPRIRLNSICPYFTMFPLNFPYEVLVSAQPNDIVFDPFCGRGTTNFAARLRGLTTYGIDSNPVAKAIADAKLVNISSSRILTLAKKILHSDSSISSPKGEFWKLAYHEDTLEEICKIRSYFETKKELSKTDIALKAIMLGILHGPQMIKTQSYLSNQMPRTFATKPDYSIKYWKERKLKPVYVNTLKLITKKANYIFNSELEKGVNGKILLGDSRSEIHDKIEDRFNWIVTSPPYYGMSTYEQDQWLRNWFLGGSSNIDYNTQNQLKHNSETSFISDLSQVWKNVALNSASNAKLIVRFGALPSKSGSSPSDILKASIKLADERWKINTIKKIANPIEAKRQSNQFKNTHDKYIEEIDLYATLND